MLEQSSVPLKEILRMNKKEQEATVKIIEVALTSATGIMNEAQRMIDFLNERNLYGEYVLWTIEQDQLKKENA